MFTYFRVVGEATGSVCLVVAMETQQAMETRQIVAMETRQMVAMETWQVGRRESSLSSSSLVCWGRALCVPSPWQPSRKVSISRLSATHLTNSLPSICP